MKLVIVVVLLAVVVFGSVFYFSRETRPEPDYRVLWDLTCAHRDATASECALVWESDTANAKIVIDTCYEYAWQEDALNIEFRIRFLDCLDSLG